MLSILATGLNLGFCTAYLKGDPVIMVANSVSLALLGSIIVFKMREPC